MKLIELKRGQSARIVSIGNIGELKKRLVDMGVTAGEIITFQRKAPLGDPQQYIIKSTGIAIRYCDAINIEIQKCDQ